MNADHRPPTEGIELPGLGSGQFDHHEPEFIADPWPTYKHLRRTCPVSHSDRYDGFWLVSRYDDVVEAAADWETFTSSVPGVLLIPPGSVRDFPFLPLESDPPTHTLYRQLAAPMFAPRVIKQLVERVREWAATLMAPLVDQDECDLVVDFAAPMSSGTLAMFIGLPTDDRDLWLDFVRRSFEGTVHDPEDAKRAGAEMAAYLDRLVADRRDDPRDDPISRLMASEVDGTALTDAEIRGFLLLILIAGHETTASVISYMFWHLSRHPDVVEHLRADPKRLPAAVEEFIRLTSPVSIFGRNATKDVEFHGAEIGEGDVVGLSFASANRDETHFDDAETCRLDRRPNRHLAFGSGIHICIGAALARLEITTSLQTFLDTGCRLRPGAEEMQWKGRGDALAIAHLPAVLTLDS